MKFFLFLLTLLAGSVLATNAHAQLTVSRIFNDGAVLQRNQPIPVWGTAAANAEVTVTLNGVSTTETADAEGNWEVTLAARGAGGPFFISITSGGQQIDLTDIYFGDVWLASGQSNMEWALSQSDNAAAVIAAANDPTIRHFKVQKGLANEPSDTLPAGSIWTPATSQFVGNFSAVGYYFARDLRPHAGVPIGILNTSYGGSRIEAWMSDEMLGYDETNIVLANGEPERQPTLAYNKMLHPLLRFPIKGFLWYQGESNADNLDDALAYGDLFQTMITAWRELWGQDDLPFLWVQLPNFSNPPGNQPSTFDAWPRLREGQSAALALPNTGEAVTIDVGDVDIHPTNKEPVGHRLSLVARKVVYGEDLVASGPRYRANLLGDDGRVAIDFSDFGSGLVAEGTTNGVVNGFAIQASGGPLVWANAMIEGNQVMVWSDDVPEPFSVRYAWEYNPADANLYNAEGLPTAPFLAIVNPGFKIATLEAARTVIEQGQSTELSWLVFGAATITLNGAPVDSAGTMTVMPEATTTYTLEATNRDDLNDIATAAVTIEVLDPNLINRTMNQPASASTFESCCGADLIADLAVDGDLQTRWSSAWQSPGDPNTDDDPDDEWLMVDLGETIDVERVILSWEAAFGSGYDLELSHDSYLWRTVFEERAGDGGEDNIVFDTPPSGRYLRMQGVTRATEFGYSLWEIAAYGPLATSQPPAVSVSSATGNVLIPGTNATLIATATDADGNVEQAQFFVDGVLLESDDEAPFETSWTPNEAGEYIVTVIVQDNSGIMVQSDPLTVYVLADDTLTIYEAEDGITTGGTANVIVRNSAAASGGAYLELRDGWTLTFPDVQAPVSGTYLMSIGYQLTFESPKTQYLVVNGDTLEAVEFTAPSTTAWLQRGLTVPLLAGTNEVALHGFWNWMSIDYIGLSMDAVIVGTEASNEFHETVALDQNYPNPFNPTTTIGYTLPEAGPVLLEVYDLTGRRLATLVDGTMPAGTHTVAFEADGLASGLYFYKLQAGGTIQTRRMVLVR